MADNCNLGQTSYGENLSWSLTKEKNVIFMVEGEEAGRGSDGKLGGRKARVEGAGGFPQTELLG